MSEEALLPRPRRDDGKMFPVTFPRAAQSSLVTPSLAFLVNSAMEMDCLLIAMVHALRQSDALATVKNAAFEINTTVSRRGFIQPTATGARRSSARKEKEKRKKEKLQE